MHVAWAQEDGRSNKNQIRQEREQSPVSCVPYLGEHALILQGTLFMPLRPLPRVPAVALPLCSYAGRQSMVKQHECAFEIPLYFFIVIAAVKCF